MRAGTGKGGEQDQTPDTNGSNRKRSEKSGKRILRIPQIIRNSNRRRHQTFNGGIGMRIEFVDKNGRTIVITCGGDIAAGEIMLEMLSKLPDSEFIMRPVHK